MIWFWIIFVVIILLTVLGLIWAFKTSFVRNDIRLIDINSKLLAKYKDVFFESMQYNDKLSSEEVYIKSFDGLKLAGVFYNNNSNNTILLFHGYRSEGKFDFACAVRFYIEIGLNVLVVDQRAHGDSQGKLITFGIKERRDVLSWINYINDKYRPQDLFISGVSMGATAVMMAANLNLPSNVRGIIADCGFTAAPDIIKKVARESYKINATPILPVLNFMCKVIGKFDLYETTTEKSLSKSNIPIFFIHGKSDGFVPFEMTKISYAAANAEKYIHLVEGADHGISFLVDTDNIKNKISIFIKKYSS